jgi:hypothetical protein
LMQYQTRTDLPASVKAQLYNSDDTLVSSVTYGNTTYPTQMAYSLNTTVHSQIQHLIQIT